MKNTIFLIILSLIMTGCTTVKQAKVVPGMTKEDVKLAWNGPQYIENNKNSCCHKPGEEAWYYFQNRYQNPKQPKYILFKDGVVQDVFVWHR